MFLDPGIANLVAEYGSAVEQRPGTYSPHWGDITDQPQFPWRSGQALWSGFDHGSIAGQLGLTGIVDYFRLPKRAWYWYREAYLGIHPPPWPQPGEPFGLSLEANSPNIHHADGTEDVQLIVSVLDKEGRQISNSPPVTLKIEAGPGELPTGRAITFKHGTDIDIRDGKAAIEFRSYYSGKTQIRASSSGLREAVIVITSAGAPAYRLGHTTLFQPPPYAPYSIQHTQNRVMDDENIALDRPTRASSEASGHHALQANDGNPNTSWSATPDRSGPVWWDVDLEGFYRLTKVIITFPEAGNYRYQIQVSADLSQWVTIADRSCETLSGRPVENPLPAEAKGRGIRIVLVRASSERLGALSEVVVNGAGVAP
jgi:hypothetical protein